MSQTHGETLRTRRKVRGVTIVELSERTGLSQAELVHAELGQAVLTDGQRQKVDEFIRRRRIIRDFYTFGQ